MRPKAQALPRRSGAALLVAIALTTAACGQKSGVADQVPLSLGSGSEMNGPATALLEGTVQAAGSELVTSGSATVMSDGSTQGATTDPAGGSSTTSPEETAGAYEPLDELIRADKEPMGGSRTGVTNDTITIGMHFPFTGSAPNPGAIDRDNFSLYWRYIAREGRSIFGRDVELVTRDDQTSPTGAATACHELAEGDKVFLVIGYAYPSLIQACARVLAARGVPYLPMGSGEATVASYPNHFSLSAPYSRQAATIANLLVTRFNALRVKNAYVRTKGSSEIDAQRPVVEMRKRGASFDYNREINIQPNAQELAGVALELKQRNVKNIWFGGSPYHFQAFMFAAERQGYNPQLVGGGLTVVHDGVLKLVCGAGSHGDGSLFLHPFPGFGDRSDFDPNFDRAGGNDEFIWGQWGIARIIERVLKLPGRNLTRERLLWHLTRAAPIETGVMPTVRYTSDNHFTDHSMHLTEANCNGNNSRWITVKPFLRLLR